MNENVNTRLCIRALLVTILIGLLMYSFFGEKQPYNDGQGWDGRLYYEMCNHSIHDIAHHAYSTYYVQRFLPFAFVNALQMVFGYDHTMAFMMFAIFLATMIGVWGFFKVSNHLRLKVGVEAIAFAFMFYHIGLLRCGYAPYQTDPFALAMGIWFFYFFLKKQKWPMIGVAFIGAFIWQSVWPVACALFALPWDSYNITQPKRLNTIGEKSTEVVKMLMLLIPVVCLAYLIKICLKYELPIDQYAELVPYFYSASYTGIVSLTLSIICITGYIAYLLYPIHFDLFGAIKHSLKSFKILDVLGAIVLFVSMYVIVHVVADLSIKTPYSVILATRRIMWEPLTLPLKFLECHLLQYGLVIAFFLIYYKQILQVAQKHSFGYLFCLVYIVAMGAQTESRFIINMLPFLVFPIVVVMNHTELRKWVAPIIVVAQLVLSHFWFHINIPEILATTITEDDDTYLQYPLQRMFEFGGPWQSPENYYKWTTIFACTLLIVYILHRKGFFYKK